MLKHGGGILEASRRHGIPVGDWLDLSTGLNPNGWPAPAITAEAWLRLPETTDGLEAAAADYYGCETLLPVAGSQAAIQTLPLMRAPCRVGMLDTTYAEHPHAWSRGGHQVERLHPDALDGAVERLDVLLVCNPNNPTGWQADPLRLEDWRQRLASRGGWLVVDEAFMDVDPTSSMLPRIGEPGLIVLRSVGKFFGLDGARVGFVFAWPELLERMADELGPWTINGPARQVVRLALEDRTWQQRMRVQLRTDSERLATCLRTHGLEPTGSSALFQWLAFDEATALHTFLAERGILTRLFTAPVSTRFGLPANEGEWVRLEAALAEWAQARP